MKDDKLRTETRDALKEEEERRKRIAEREALREKLREVKALACLVSNCWRVALGQVLQTRYCPDTVFSFPILCLFQISPISFIEILATSYYSISLHCKLKSRSLHQFYDLTRFKLPLFFLI